MAIPKRVYHYTKRTTALEKILPNTSLRIGSLSETNDPRETKEWGLLLEPMPAPLADAFRWEQMTQVQHTANELRRKEWWVLCTTVDDPDLKEPGPDRPDFTHFKYGHARARMWAQYAENHTGVCLVFDGPALHDAIEAAAAGAVVHLGNVTYADEYECPLMIERLRALQVSYARVLAAGTETALREHMTGAYEHYFLEKSRDWESEREFRWLLNGNAGPYFVDIKNALRGVIAGVDFPAGDAGILRSLSNNLGIKAERMNWSNRVPSKQVWEPT